MALYKNLYKIYTKRTRVFSCPSLNPVFTAPFKMHPLELLAVWNWCEMSLPFTPRKMLQDCPHLTELTLEVEVAWGAHAEPMQEACLPLFLLALDSLASW